MSQVITPALLRGWPLPSPDDYADKEQRGRVLVVGGGAETPGAVVLAGLGALRVGAGKLQVATAAEAAVVVAVALPEARVRPLPALDVDAVEQVVVLAQDADAVLVGPGTPDPDAAADLVTALLGRLGDVAVLLDAFALPARPDAREAAAAYAGPLVITPNLAEGGTMTGSEIAPEQAGAVAARLAAEMGAVVALRGAESWVADPSGRTWCNTSGSVGLGTSGSGDVLAGALAGLVARGAEPAQAAVWAVHAHARAGDRLAARVGRLGFLARELPDELPGVLTELQG